MKILISQLSCCVQDHALRRGFLCESVEQAPVVDHPVVSHRGDPDPRHLEFAPEGLPFVAQDIVLRHLDKRGWQALEVFNAVVEVQLETSISAMPGPPRLSPLPPLPDGK